MANTVSNQEFYESIVRSGNSILEKLRDKLSMANYLPFGQAFNQGNPQLVAESLIAHRIINKWHRPDRKKTTQLKEECFRAWEQHEEYLWDIEFDKSHFNVWHWKACDLIRTWLKPFKKELVNLEALQDMSVIDLEFTPGETFISSKGKVSVKQKLMSEEWTVTYDRLDWACLLVSKHSTLKMCAYEKLWKHFSHPDMQNQLGRALHGKISRDDLFIWACKHFLFQVVNGARASSVPKNNSVRRFINIEPLFNVIYQRCVALIVRRALAKAGNGLGDGQHVHRKLIRILRYSTLDLRNASDSNLFDAAEAILRTACPELWFCVCAGRSYTTTLTYPNGDVKEVVNKKLSSMGNGYTFEIMTLILLSQARVVDPEARVYGDDIILQTQFAEDYIGQINLSGWQVNPNKTFIGSNFRESCGGFHLIGYGDLVSYDIEYLESFQDYITVCNKFRKILDFRWMQDVADAYDLLVRLCPALHKGPPRDQGVLGFNLRKGFNETCDTLNIDFVEVSNCKQSYSRKERSRDAWCRGMRTWEQAKDSLLVSNRPIGVIEVPRFKPKLATPTLRTISDYSTLGHYLYSNRVSDDVLRGKGHWSFVTCFVFDDGYVLPIARVKLWLRDFKRATQQGPKPISHHSTGCAVTMFSRKRDEMEFWKEIFNDITIAAAA